VWRAIASPWIQAWLQVLRSVVVGGWQAAAYKEMLFLLAANESHFVRKQSAKCTLFVHVELWWCVGANIWQLKVGKKKVKYNSSVDASLSIPKLLLTDVYLACRRVAIHPSSKKAKRCSRLPDTTETGINRQPHPRVSNRKSKPRIEPWNCGILIYVSTGRCFYVGDYDRIMAQHW